MSLIKIELRTLAPKKWILSLYGQKPTIDINYRGVGKGCHVGDLVIDDSQDPNYIWMCTKQTRNASDFILVSPIGNRTETIINNYEVNIDTDKVIPVNANNNDVEIYLPVGIKIDGKNKYELNTLNESVTLYSPHGSGKELSIKRVDSSDNTVIITAIGSSALDNWLAI